MSRTADPAGGSGGADSGTPAGAQTRAFGGLRQLTLPWAGRTRGNSAAAAARSRSDPVAVVTAAHERLCRAGVTVAVQLWDGTDLGPSDRGYRLVLRQPWSLRAMFLPVTDLRVGEAYLRDDIDVDGSMLAAMRDIGASGHLLRTPRLRAALLVDLLRLPPPPRRSAVDRAVPLKGRLHSRARDRRAVQRHYDIGNEFYAMFLDRGLVYSCAYFHPDDPLHADPVGEDLERAQVRKLELICRKLTLQPGDRLLDIGCGWGSLLIHAASHHGVSGVGVTLSEQQVQLARRRIAAAGLTGRVEVRLQDYRDVADTFDAVASVGMFEHVGTTQLDAYFRACHRLTRPGGRFLNHGITTGHRTAVRDLSKDPDSFVGRHVFPDGALVPAHVAAAHLERAGFELVDMEQLRPHYARTLTHWVARLEANREAARLAGGEAAYRTWRAYMAGSAVGFENGDLGVVQLLGTRGDARIPLGRAWMIPQEPPLASTPAGT